MNVVGHAEHSLAMPAEVAAALAGPPPLDDVAPPEDDRHRTDRGATLPVSASAAVSWRAAHWLNELPPDGAEGDADVTHIDVSAAGIPRVSHRPHRVAAAASSAMGASSASPAREVPAAAAYPHPQAAAAGAGAPRAAPSREPWLHVPEADPASAGWTTALDGIRDPATRQRLWTLHASVQRILAQQTQAQLERAAQATASQLPGEVLGVVTAYLHTPGRSRDPHRGRQAGCDTWFEPLVESDELDGKEDA